MNNKMVSAFLVLPAVIVGLTLHEFAHAYVSYRCGDSTAKDEGRLTLNPLRHIDIMGLVFLVFAGFGWAKPVQFNPAKLKNPRRDTMLIALAGPLTNLVLGILFSIVFALVIHFFPLSGSNPDVMWMYVVLKAFAMINLGLFVFNILPIPPLDGSHVLFQKLNLSKDLEYKIFSWGTAGLFVLLVVGQMFNINVLPIGEVVRFVFNLIVRALIW